MRIQGIIHQQICQLKWHILACFGLIMVLPIEEALVDLKEGDGVHSSTMVIASVMFGPLLAGLIACANVQGDLNEKLYIFWRSKPANVKLLITLKFFIGLIVSLVILVCPVAFGIISGGVSAEYLSESDIRYFLPFPVLLTIMTYSLCFGGNVLVRSTARAWLVGMLLAGFLLLLPFILPLNYKDFMNMFEMTGIYFAIIPVASVIAFVFSLFAAQHDWHLRTNLKGLLWVGAGLVFVLMTLFSRQVANIKVLQEKEIVSREWIRDSLDSVGDKVIFQEQSYIDIDNNKISFSDINGSPDDIAVPITRMEGYYSEGYRGTGRLIKVVGDNLYCFNILIYYRNELIEREEKKPIYKHIYEKVYLRCYKYTNHWRPVCELDISDCLTDNSYPQVAMRLIDNKIITLIDNSFIVVDATNPKELKLIDKKRNVLKNRWGYYHERRKEFSIPLLPVEELGMEDRIKLSIDCNYRFSYLRSKISETSIVDIYDGKIKFFLVNDNNIAGFDVIRWDNENIYCKFITARPFTILECLTDSFHSNNAFVKSGKLYCYNYNTLLVLDTRSKHKIRKLGHFVRMDYAIEDIAVLENDNILLLMHWTQNFGKSPNNQSKKRYLCLLENPG